MKNLAQLVVGGLAVIGIGAAGYRAYKLKKLSEEIKEEKIIEIEVSESEDGSRK